MEDRLWWLECAVWEAEAVGDDALAWLSAWPFWYGKLFGPPPLLSGAMFAVPQMVLSVTRLLMVRQERDRRPLELAEEEERC